MAHQSLKRIPYGLADYGRIRQDNSYYVDKTRFIPVLEAQSYFLCLLRPRRFGKSLWLSLLQHYYGVNRQAEFDFLFGDTYIGQHPTAERNSYLIIFLNFGQLRSIIETGETISAVVPSFPLAKLRERENFISQLVFLGLLTFGGEREGEPLLRIPNQTIKDLMYSYLREGFQDVDIFRLDIWRLGNLMRGMVYRGEWQPFFDFVAQGIREQTSIRDYLGGEKMIQDFLLAYLNVSQFFLTWSEKEMGGGFADFYLEPFLARYPDMRFGYLVELEYIARSEFTEAKRKEKILEAEGQLRRYADDPRIQAVAARVPLKKLVLIYNGWELIYSAEWQPSQA